MSDRPEWLLRLESTGQIRRGSVAPGVDPDELCDGNGRPVRSTGPSIPHGCWRCCTLCNVDRHQCPGCGAPLEHGVGACLRCRNDLQR